MLEFSIFARGARPPRRALRRAAEIALAALAILAAQLAVAAPFIGWVFRG